MADKIKIILPLIIILALALIGIIGYTADESGLPVRVLFKTKGGNIIFSHRTHLEDYGLECVKCHHRIEEGKPVLVWDCRACHRAGTDYDSICADRPVHKQCIGANCIDCHREMGMDEKECGLCHRSR
jgi:hypothetical protein